MIKKLIGPLGIAFAATFFAGTITNASVRLTLDTYLINNCSGPIDNAKNDRTGLIIVAQDCFNKEGTYVGNRTSGEVGNVYAAPDIYTNSLGHLIPSFFGLRNYPRLSVPMEELISTSRIDQMKSSGIKPVADWKRISGAEAGLPSMDEIISINDKRQTGKTGLRF